MNLRELLVIISCIICHIAIFMVDLQLPLGVSIGLLYIFPVLLAFMLKNNLTYLIFSLFPVPMIILGFFLSPSEGLDLQFVIADKILSCLAIVSITVLGAVIRRNTDTIEKYSKELKRSNKELEQFAYIASHDLQEPLRMVSSYMKLLEKHYKDKLDDKAKEFINFAVDGAQRMSNLINALLDYSRLGSKETNKERINLNEVLKTVLKTIETKTIETNTSIEFSDLPELEVDKTQFSQLLQNLIVNAMKFTKNTTPKIRIEAAKNNNSWIFSVKDNGIGIPSHEKERVFQIFQRLHTKDAYEGTGIGLSVCKKIVERHGGKIWVESKEGKGSTFYFIIPSTN